MPGGSIGALALALGLGLAGFAAHGKQVVGPAASQRAIAAPEVNAIDSQLAALAQGADADGLASRLDSIAADRSLEAVAQEWLLDRGLHHLATLAPTAAARRTVTRLSTRAPVVFTRVDPDHGDRTTPLYDVGATARFVLRAWQRAAARDAALAELQAGLPSAVERFAGRAARAQPDPVREGIAEAFAAAPLTQLAAQRAAVLAAIARGAQVDELALTLATRLVDAELLDAVLGHADAPVALAAVRAAPQAFDRQTAFGLLATASRRADIASASVLEIGGLARADAGARAFLFDAIDDPALGPSAATALAGLGDAGVAAEAGRRLRATRSELRRRMLVLTLKLDGSDAALDELRRFADTRQGSVQLQAEVEQWLER